METYSLLSTNERELILKEILYKTESFTVTEISKKLKLHKSFISKFFSILCKEKIISRKKRNFSVLDNIYVNSLRLLFNLSIFEEKLFSKFPKIKAAGLYGSWSKGTNNEESDLDIWIKLDKLNDEKISEIQYNFSSKFKNPKILFLDDNKLLELKSKETMFYHSIVFGSLILYGDINEIYK